MMLSRRVVLAAPLLVGGLAGVRAAWAADAAAAAPIEGLNRAILGSMKAGTGSAFMTRYNLLAPAVDQAFDLPGILQASVGPRYAGLPAAEQTQLLDVFRKFTVASYAANFDAFNGERLELLPEQRAVGSDVVVETQLVPTRGDTVRLDYVMHKLPQGWRAIDVLLQGSISQNAVKRSDFRSLVSGSSAQPLIDSLRRKVAELSGGALS